ncbi:MAG TPA: L-threonylcarbamoyladenylate synthase [Vicinamibacterales bacterium]|nr:L-threonylcarbamoyladenylate synthase [Vicinamibacterales bacterium]
MPVHLAINPVTPDPRRVRDAVDVVRAGHVIAYPTDTQYGLGADPRDPAAVAEVFAIKGRDAARSLPLIAGSFEQAQRTGLFDARARRLAARFWPGPLTLVVPQAMSFAAGVAEDGRVALRVPDHALARALAQELGCALTATSANRSGAPAAATADDVAAALGDLVSCIVDGGAAPGGAPSTIVDVSGGAPRLVRAGAVPWERVLESLE